MTSSAYLVGKDNAIVIEGNNLATSEYTKIVAGDYRFTTTIGKTVNIIIRDHDREEPLKLTFAKGTLNSLRLILIGEIKKALAVAFTLEDGAKVLMTQIVLSASASLSQLTTMATLKANASLRIDDCILHQGAMVLKDAYALEGEGANLYHRTLNIASGSDSISRIQSVEHKAMGTISELENYLIAVDSAKLKYDVEGIIEKGNRGSSCTQFNRGLIFGEHAEIEADPKLLIDEFDVNAAHGAAIGQVNEDELFYLLSRGLSETEAKRLIVSGYVTPFSKTINDPEIENHVNYLIEQKIKGAGII